MSNLLTPDQEQEILFSKIRSHQHTLVTLSSFIQNPIKDLGVTPDMLQEFIDMSSKLQQDIQADTNLIVDFILRNVGK